jgi:hypothetical protein
MPLLATRTVDCNSPVLGLYRSLVLPVKIVVGTPVVTEANKGKTLVAVLVSLLILAPETTVSHEVFVPLVVKYLPELLV